MFKSAQIPVYGKLLLNVNAGHFHNYTAAYAAAD